MGGIWLTGGKQKYAENNPSQCRIINHKSHTNCPGIETGPAVISRRLRRVVGEYVANTTLCTGESKGYYTLRLSCLFWVMTNKVEGTGEVAVDYLQFFWHNLGVCTRNKTNCEN